MTSGRRQRNESTWQINHIMSEQETLGLFYHQHTESRRCPEISIQRSPGNECSPVEIHVLRNNYLKSQEAWEHHLTFCHTLTRIFNNSNWQICRIFECMWKWLKMVTDDRLVSSGTLRTMAIYPSGSWTFPTLAVEVEEKEDHAPHPHFQLQPLSWKD